MRQTRQGDERSPRGFAVGCRLDGVFVGEEDLGGDPSFDGLIVEQAGRITDR
jgi:hypothetical protein